MKLVVKKDTEKVKLAVPRAYMGHIVRAGKNMSYKRKGLVAQFEVNQLINDMQMLKC